MPSDSRAATWKRHRSCARTCENTFISINYLRSKNTLAFTHDPPASKLVDFFRNDGDQYG